MLALLDFAAKSGSASAAAAELMAEEEPRFYTIAMKVRHAVVLHAVKFRDFVCSSTVPVHHSADRIQALTFELCDSYSRLRSRTLLAILRKCGRSPVLSKTSSLPAPMWMRMPNSNYRTWQALRLLKYVG